MSRAATARHGGYNHPDFQAGGTSSGARFAAGRQHRRHGRERRRHEQRHVDQGAEYENVGQPDRAPGGLNLEARTRPGQRQCQQSADLEPAAAYLELMQQRGADQMQPYDA
jgi:hypothetical protein